MNNVLWNKGKRVLILYPNLTMNFALPHSVAIISSCLKEQECVVELFDTTLYKLDNVKSDDDIRVELGQFPHVDVPGIKTTDMYKDFQKLVDVFKPDMIMVTLVENTIDLGVSLLSSLNEHIYTILGGVSAICNPKRFKGNPLFDLVWGGSAESLILGTDKKRIYEDYTVFESPRFYRPWSGKLLKTIPWHTGVCPYNCSFCCAKCIRVRLGVSSRFSIDDVLGNLEFQISTHKPEFIHFTTESFLTMKKSDFDKFIDFYKKYRIPFWCQSTVNDITSEKVEALAGLNCFKINIGIETGNEEYRKSFLNKPFSNEKAKIAVGIISRNGIRLGLNNMLGLPLETKDLILDTIVFNQELYHIAVDNNCPDIMFSCFMFQPYHGTKLREFCVEHSLLRSNHVGVVNQGDIVLDNPHVSDNELYWFEKNFVSLVKNNVDRCNILLEVGN